MIKKIVLNKINKTIDNQGTTILEMVVCFALLGIFLVAAGAFISHVTMLYYNTKGEIAAREVSDIILEKVSSEIDGAETFEKCGVLDPEITDAKKPNGTSVVYKQNGVDTTTPVKSLDLYDKTDTHVNISYNPEKDNIKIHYYEINSIDSTKDKSKTDWYFDDSVYNGYVVKDLIMIPANKLSEVTSGDSGFSLANYGLTASDSSYPSNVMVILLHLKHPRYDDYYAYRFVKMYNLDENYNWDGNTSNP